MRQVFLDKGNIILKDVCEPLLDENSVLVAVHYSFISSGTELSTIEKAGENIFFSNVPHKIKRVINSVSKHGIEEVAAIVKVKMKGRLQTLGYSCSGEIIAVGKNIKNLRPGDLVACAGASIAHHADIICIPENLVTQLSTKKSLKAASMVTIGTIAIQGIRRANLQLGEHVCIIGLGVLGQITAQLAKISGCKILAIDTSKERLNLAKNLGADHVYHATKDNIAQEAELITDGQGVDCTIVTASSKSDSIIQKAMAITRKKGKVVLVGDVGLNIDYNPFYSKEIDLLVSYSYGPGRYDNDYENKGRDYPYSHVRWTENRNMKAFVELIEKNKINTEKLISQTIDIDHVKKAYEKIKDKKTLGIILTYRQKNNKKKETKKEKTKSETITFKPAIKDQIRVGIIGSNRFSNNTLNPIISQQNNIIVNAVVDKDISKSINMSRLYGAKKYFNKESNLFKENIVDVLVISSKHQTHCEKALNAMRNGKAVFLEKPMATNFDQLEQITDFIKKNPKIPFCVDYERSFSRFIQKIKNEVKHRHTPLVLNYRMNVELMQKKHFTKKDMSSGRIIGQACSIFDLFCFLTDSKPVSISVESLDTKLSKMFPTDNFCAQIRFKDGSMCSLVYTSLGSSESGKERMELFFDSKTIIMEDYKVLKGFGVRNSFGECLTYPDKGRETIIETFFDNLNDKQFVPPISLDRLYTASHIALVVDQLACQGGGEKNIRSNS